MKQRLYKIALSATILISVLLLSSCGSHEAEISIKIETYLQEEYGEEFEVLSWKHPKLLPSDNGVIHATCISKNDSKHPFEGSYFNPEEPNSKIEIIDDGYAERLLAKQMENMTEEAVSQVAENYYIQGLYLKNGKTFQWGKFHSGKSMLNFATRWSQIIKL